MPTLFIYEKIFIPAIGDHFLVEDKKFPAPGSIRKSTLKEIKSIIKMLKDAGVNIILIASSSERGDEVRRWVERNFEASINVTDTNKIETNEHDYPDFMHFLKQHIALLETATIESIAVLASTEVFEKNTDLTIQDNISVKCYSMPAIYELDFLSRLLFLATNYLPFDQQLSLVQCSQLPGYAKTEMLHTLTVSAKTSQPELVTDESSDLFLHLRNYAFNGLNASNTQQQRELYLTLFLSMHALHTTCVHLSSPQNNNQLSKDIADTLSYFLKSANKQATPGSKGCFDRFIDLVNRAAPWIRPLYGITALIVSSTSREWVNPPITQFDKDQYENLYVALLILFDSFKASSILVMSFFLYFSAQILWDFTLWARTKLQERDQLQKMDSTVKREIQRSLSESTIAMQLARVIHQLMLLESQKRPVSAQLALLQQLDSQLIDHVSHIHARLQTANPQEAGIIWYRMNYFVDLPITQAANLYTKVHHESEQKKRLAFAYKVIDTAIKICFFVPFALTIYYAFHYYNGFIAAITDLSSSMHLPQTAQHTGNFTDFSNDDDAGKYTPLELSALFAANMWHILDWTYTAAVIVGGSAPTLKLILRTFDDMRQKYRLPKPVNLTAVVINSPSPAPSPVPAAEDTGLLTGTTRVGLWGKVKSCLPYLQTDPSSANTQFANG